LQEREQQSQITGIGHVDVRIDFCAVVLKQAAHALKNFLHRQCVSGAGGLAGGQQRLSGLAAILVQDKYGEDIAKKHASRNQGNATENQKATRTHGREACGNVGRS
jgi:hypothetical protein